MGSADRVIRLLVAALIIVLYFTNLIGGIAGIVLLILAEVFILTGFIRFCALNI